MPLNARHYGWDDLGHLIIKQSHQHMPYVILCSKENGRDSDNLLAVIRNKPKYRLLQTNKAQAIKDVGAQYPLFGGQGQFIGTGANAADTRGRALQGGVAVFAKFQIRRDKVVEDKLKSRSASAGNSRLHTQIASLSGDHILNLRIHFRGRHKPALNTVVDQCAQGLGFDLFSLTFMP